MKQTLLTFGILLIVALPACNSKSQSDAMKEAEHVQSAIKENTPGSIPATDGRSMKAKIGGKDWAATSMMPTEAAGRIIGYYNGEYIGLPYDRRYLVAGKKISFGEDNAVDLATNDDVGMWGGRKGEMQITKVDENWAEGTFFFTASTSSSNKTLEVTDGFFRIPLSGK